ncbi:hypothetical protein X975_01640, partial [Stegodyphus mimosarum]
MVSEKQRKQLMLKIPLPQCCYQNFPVIMKILMHLKLHFKILFLIILIYQTLKRFFYLHASVKGKARQMETTGDIYELLVKAREERYKNKRILIDTHIQNIMSYPKLKWESAKELYDLLDCLKKNLSALELLSYEH